MGEIPLVLLKYHVAMSSTTVQRGNDINACFSPRKFRVTWPRTTYIKNNSTFSAAVRLSNVVGRRRNICEFLCSMTSRGYGHDRRSRGMLSSTKRLSVCPWREF